VVGGRGGGRHKITHVRDCGDPRTRLSHCLRFLKKSQEISRNLKLWLDLKIKNRTLTLSNERVRARTYAHTQTHITHQIGRAGEKSVDGEKLAEGRGDGNAEGDVFAESHPNHAPHEPKHLASCVCV